MKAVRVWLLLGVTVTLMVLSISPGVNSSAPINSGTEQAQGWPLPPKPKVSDTGLSALEASGRTLVAQGWPLPPKPKVYGTGLSALEASGRTLVAQGWPLPPKPKVYDAGLSA